MNYFMVRHKKTGEFMPELREGRGYSHWNPGMVNTLQHLNIKLLGVPRLFSTRRRAEYCITRWIELPNAFHKNYETSLGLSEVVETREDNRTKEDLEIVEVELRIVP